MTILLKSQKMLWGRAAGRCSNPACKMDLYEDETQTDDPTLVGENCHIVAESDDGPRADPMMPKAQRNSYSNLILLCRNHHKIIDAQPGEYTVEKLHQMKANHEAWVGEQLAFDATQQRDDEYYAGLVDKWEQLAHVDHWQAWSSHVLSHGQPSMAEDLDEDLYSLRGWLLNRIWPGRYPALEAAFKNFHLVLQDFQEEFRAHAEPWRDSKTLMTPKFYQINEWNPGRYARLLKQYEFHVDLVEDLMLELSRAGNLICDHVRHYLMYSYRLAQGRLVIQTGPTIDLTFQDVVVQYSVEERDRAPPYPGLEEFLVERTHRDMHFGEGTKP